MTGYRLLYDAKSAAEMLSTTEERIEELRSSYLLIAVKDGDEYRFTHKELERYAESLLSEFAAGLSPRSRAYHEKYGVEGNPNMRRERKPKAPEK